MTQETAQIVLEIAHMVEQLPREKREEWLRDVLDMAQGGE